MNEFIVEFYGEIEQLGEYADKTDIGLIRINVFAESHGEIKKMFRLCKPEKIIQLTGLQV